MQKELNEPTREGYEVGYKMSLYVDREEKAGGPLANGSRRCATCAFRQGTYANGSPVTMLDAVKCAMEGHPFDCHEEIKPCAGWALLRRASEGQSVQVPWPFTDEMPRE